jgi:hypothetical protein
MRIRIGSESLKSVGQAALKLHLERIVVRTRDIGDGKDTDEVWSEVVKVILPRRFLLGGDRPVCQSELREMAIRGLLCLVDPGGETRDVMQFRSALLGQALQPIGCPTVKLMIENAQGDESTHIEQEHHGNPPGFPRPVYGLALGRWVRRSARASP